MRFDKSKANRFYREMFHEDIDYNILLEVESMTDEEFEAACDQFDENGEPTNSPLSAGQWDCIDAARY